MFSQICNKKLAELSGIGVKKHASKNEAIYVVRSLHNILFTIKCANRC